MSGRSDIYKHPDSLSPPLWRTTTAVTANANACSYIPVHKLCIQLAVDQGLVLLLKVALSWAQPGAADGSLRAYASPWSVDGMQPAAGRPSIGPAVHYSRPHSSQILLLLSCWGHPTITWFVRRQTKLRHKQCLNASMHAIRCLTVGCFHRSAIVSRWKVTSENTVY